MSHIAEVSISKKDATYVSVNRVLNGSSIGVLSEFWRKSSFFGLFFALHQTVFPNFPSHLLVQLCSCRDPVVYEQKVEHLLAVVLVDCADQHAV